MAKLDKQVVLITGGTGSFGRKLVEILLRKHKPKKVIVFSRDELKQLELREKFCDDRLRFFLGDIRDVDRLRRAFQEVDIVVHAAALKQVPACEYNPFEAVKTNILGAQNIIDAAIDCGVKRVVALSTDKAVNPVNLYGATKLVHEKLFVDGNAYTGQRQTRFTVVRYGNVVGSRGSVIPLFVEKRRTGVIPVTDKRMTRFWIALEDSVEFVLKCLATMRGGEIFVPKVPSMRITDLAAVIAPDCKLEYVGIRPGEKLHEMLIQSDEARRGVEYEDFFVILPEPTAFRVDGWKDGRVLPKRFVYSSDTNSKWLTPSQMKVMLARFLETSG